MTSRQTDKTASPGVTVEKLTGEDTLRWACEMTLRPGQTSKASFAKMLMCEHSPIRTQFYRITLRGVPSFVAIHFLRHGIGSHPFDNEPFVQSLRDDRRGGELTDEQINRLTPVNQGLLINAQGLIAISRKRLCLQAHSKTVAWWTRVRKAMTEVDPIMAAFMVPECVYRNGLCPELRMCKAGVDKVCSAYPAWPGNRGDR